jgi:hypothetical protein
MRRGRGVDVQGEGARREDIAVGVAGFAEARIVGVVG